MVRMNRTDILLMMALENGKADTPAFGLTIKEIMNLIEDNGNKKCKMTVYRRLRGLVEYGYIAKGFFENHADTFYLLDKGKEILSEGRSK